MYNLYIPVQSLLILLLIMIIFFSKKKIITSETRIYGILLGLSLLNIILNITAIYLAYKHGVPDILYLLNHLDLPIYFFWASLFCLYLLYIFLGQEKFKLYKKIRIFVILINFILIVISLFLPLEVINENGIMYAKGTCVNFAYTISTIYLILSVILTALLIIKNKEFKKIIPVLSLIVLGTTVAVINRFIPQLIIVPSMLVLLELIMYFTIENPDYKLMLEMSLIKEEAIKANNAKTDFLSSMSHEIRTPLNAIVGFSHIIKDAEDLAEAKENASDIVSASNVLLEMVNGILDVSKIESGNMTLEVEQYELKKLVETVINTIKNRAQEKNLEMRVNLAEDLPKFLIGDQANIKKILLNLLTNAVKYTNEGFVSLNIHCINKNDICNLIINVEDSGRGIKPEYIDKLFVKFNRLDMDKNTTTEGTGLGLAITKKLIELMNGQIFVHSVYGTGSRFNVVLPQKMSEFVEVSLPKVENDEKPIFTNKTVLLIDDNTINLKIGTRLLKQYGLEVVGCLSAFNAMDLINQGRKLDLVLCDDMMPNMTGTKLMKKLKASGYKTPIVVITANAMVEHKDQYIKSGFDDYLGKPIEIVELVRVLNKFLT